MSPVQNYAASPQIGRALLSAANAGRDGTGTVVNVLTAGVYGSRVDKVTVRSLTDTTQGMIRIFLFDGTSYTLYEELAVAEWGLLDGTVASLKLVLSGMALDLPPGWSLRALTLKAEPFHIIAEGSTY